MRPSKIIQAILTTLHRPVARSRWMANYYLQAWSFVLRSMPDNRLLRRLMYTLEVIDWPDIELKPVRVILGHTTPVVITPHIGEFDFHALFHAHLRYEHEVFTHLERLMPEIDAVLEIGANVGIFTLFFAKKLQTQKSTSQVIAFEPSREAFTRLYHNVRLNQITNAQIFNCAISNQAGFTTFFEPQDHLTNGSLDEDFASIFSNDIHSTTVQVITGEEATRLLPETGSILIKIDVEGAEVQVLKSLEHFITTRRPILILEVLSLQEDALNELTFLHDIYKYYHITTHGLVQRERFMAGSSRDFLLKPKEPVF